MKNRAKCKLCDSIIESYHTTDLVVCKCGEIHVDGGDAMRCGAKHWENFLRVTDDDKIIIPRVINKEDMEKEEKVPETKEEIIEDLNLLINAYERLPQLAQYQPITQTDYIGLLRFIKRFLEMN